MTVKINICSVSFAENLQKIQIFKFSSIVLLTQNGFYAKINKTFKHDTEISERFYGHTTVCDFVVPAGTFKGSFFVLIIGETYEIYFEKWYGV